MFSRSLFACSALLFPLASMAGGISLYEAGQEGMGLANAGAAALATDPSVQMTNPAGLAELQGTQINANGQLILGDLGFSRDSSNSYSGNEGGNPLVALPGSSLFISHELDDRSSIGFALYGNFGLALDYDDDWEGRYFAQNSTVIGISLQPSYAYQLTNDLTVGVGPRFMYGFFKSDSAINNNLPGVGNADQDGQLEYRDSDWGVGANLGLLYQLNAQTKLGLAYTSAVDLDFSDSPELNDVSNPLLEMALSEFTSDRIDADMTVPQTLTASLAHQLNGDWKLLGSLGWQDWSEFGRIGVEIDSNLITTSTVADRQYQDTWHLSLGAQHQLNPKLRWNMGVAYDSSAVEDKQRTVDNPMAENWRLATGFNYQVDAGLDLHMAYTLVWMGDMPVQQSKELSGQTLSGEYKNSLLHIIGGGATWHF